MGQLIGVVIGVIIGLVIGSVLTIASLNALFGLGISYTIGTIASAIWIQIALAGVVRGGVLSAKTQK